ncbi:FecR domain-containing protein [Pedobacter sp. PLR]|uniref:FecR family protein n=1 Tax=Pedobacter sp. PLR TaxID=2994465 RepID=UPI002245B32C|nr:FecR family protein [Pedobacter sp. PLR]MCX2454314.1 FecR domain-containing protein [Pedobacter sp. PLR]
MQEEDFELADLISGYLLCTLTKEQEERLMFLLQEDKERYKLLEAYKDATPLEQRLSNMRSLDVDQAWLKIQGHSRTVKISNKPRFAFLKYAAIFLAVICASIFYFNSNEKDPGIVPDLTKNYKNDVLPGTQKAILILSDGKEVTLDKGKLAITDESGVAIVSNDGKITYNDQKIEEASEMKYNTLIVPKAGTYAVTLPDGSKVVLNAMSELKYPVSFTEKDRKVELKGEGYFEVVKDASHPFKIRLNESEIEVLGTHFNVSSYDQTAKTTLLEGSVKVSNGKKSNILVPGKQALANKEDINISKGDTEKAVAWVKGDFYFNNDALEPALIEISRWYDLKLVYKKTAPNIHISGHISRRAKLSEVLVMLKDVSNLSFSIENKNLIIN